MGGQGSGRKPDFVKRMVESKMSLGKVEGDSVVLPDYSAAGKNVKVLKDLDARYGSSSETDPIWNSQSGAYLKIADLASNETDPIWNAQSGAYTIKTSSDVDHTAIQNIGTNTHAQIDSHIADNTIHFTEASINLDNITEGTTNKFFTSTEETKLSGIETGATADQDLSNLVPYSGANQDLNLGLKILKHDDQWGMKWQFAGTSDTVEMNQAETAWKWNVGGGGVTKYRFNTTKSGSINGPILDLGLDGDATFYGNIAVSGTVDGRDIASDGTKLDGIETGAEVNNISDTDATDLTDAGDSTLHYHSADRNRANHTGTQTASTISDFDTEVSNNTDVSANTTHRNITTGNPHNVTNSDVGLSDVPNLDTTDAVNKVHTQNTDTALGSGAVAADHGTAATDQIINVCYGTGDPPTANTTTIGTLFVKYTA